MPAGGCGAGGVGGAGPGGRRSGVGPVVGADGVRALPGRGHEEFGGQQQVPVLMAVLASQTLCPGRTPASKSAL